jgi:hypothetical protein
MDDRSGCLGGLLKLLLLGWLFDWLQDNFGFGRGCSGCGCGIILLVIFLAIACSIILGTNWFDLVNTIGLFPAM